MQGTLHSAEIARPHVIPGGIFSDERGTVGFVNDFLMTDVRRFYFIGFPAMGAVRAWIGHRHERKWFAAAAGRIALVVRPLEAFAQIEAEPARVFRIEEAAPSVVAVPAGHAVGMKALSPHARLLVYSDKTLEEAKGDDIRFDKNEGFDWETL